MKWIEFKKRNEGKWVVKAQMVSPRGTILEFQTALDTGEGHQVMELLAGSVCDKKVDQLSTMIAKQSVEQGDRQ